MNGFTEPLPGLLDDPQFQIPNLPSLPDVHIAPLRNPAPSRYANAPLPLEPFTKPPEDRYHGTRNANQIEDDSEKISPPRLKPSDVLSAREAKKPHLAISELLETSNDADSQNLQLPSFVSLAVVEKSPIQEPSQINPHKRVRLEVDVDGLSRDVGRRLPRPAQKDGKQQRPVPLLPAMVTGLHEPPPSARILPSMGLDAPPNLTRSTKSSKMQVKDILTEAKQSSTHVPPEAMLNTPDLPTVELAKPESENAQSSAIISAEQVNDNEPQTAKKDTKARRVRRKWSEQETIDLIAGVKKYGFGKWKQILNDTAYVFQDRTSIDLKDRYRVFMKDQPEDGSAVETSQTQPQLASNAVGPDHNKETEAVPSKTLFESVETARPKRKRCPWTPAEDTALLQGVSKHGFQWTAIHDDPELDLRHRRATDLRDRIRNLYPEGYKKAEVRPLKSERKKVERAVQDGYASTSKSTSDVRASTSTKEKRAPASSSQELSAGPNSGSPETRRTPRGKGHKMVGDAHQTAEQVGVTLPPLALDDDDELDWGDNTLPPLLEWEEIGM